MRLDSRRISRLEMLERRPGRLAGAAEEALGAARPGERLALCTHGGAVVAAHARAGQRRRKIPAHPSASVFSVDASAGPWAFEGSRGDSLDQARPPAGRGRRCRTRRAGGG